MTAKKLTIGQLQKRVESLERQMETVAESLTLAKGLGFSLVNARLTKLEHDAARTPARRQTRPGSPYDLSAQKRVPFKP